MPMLKPIRGAHINRAHPLARGLVGFWAMLEGGGNKLYDLSGNDNHGTLTNMDTATDWVPGRNGYALDFDGVNDHVNTGGNATLDLGDFTLSAWIKLNTGTPGSEHVIICKSDETYSADNKPKMYLFNTRITPAVIQLWIRPTNGTNIGAVGVVGTTALNDGNWHFVTATRNGTTGKVFIDAREEGAATVNGGVFSFPGSNAYIGRLWAGSSGYVSYFKNLSDDVRIYNRALSAPEIRQMYLDPYAIFRTRQAMPFFVAAGGGPSLVALSAGLSFSGARSASAQKADAGVLSFSGAQSKSASRTSNAGLSFSGSKSTLATWAKSASVSFSGGVSAVTVFLKNLAASLTFSGAHARSAGKTFQSVVSFLGGISTSAQSILSAGLSFSGATVKFGSKSLVAGLSFLGGVVGQILTGVLHTLIRLLGITIKTSALENVTISFSSLENVTLISQ